MLSAMRTYVRWIDAFNYRAGRIAMYLLFAMMGILLWSSVSKTFFLPSLWTLEMAQFTLVAYYMLGGAYSMQMGSHVRMDLVYGSRTDRTKAWLDAFTVFFLIFYLCVLLYGAIDSTEYSLRYGGERSPTAWRPYMFPIKMIMCVGIFMMLLQAISAFFQDVLKLRGADV